jgi:hypothetical protein
MSPTLFRIAGKIRIVIHTQDHKPAHVHAIGPDAEAKFEIRSLGVMESYGFKPKELKLIREFLEINREILLASWEEIYGEE